MWPSVCPGTAITAKSSPRCSSETVPPSSSARASQGICSRAGPKTAARAVPPVPRLHPRGQRGDASEDRSQPEPCSSRPPPRGVVTRIYDNGAAGLPAREPADVVVRERPHRAHLQAFASGLPSSAANESGRAVLEPFTQKNSIICRTFFHACGHLPLSSAHERTTSQIAGSNSLGSAVLTLETRLLQDDWPTWSFRAAPDRPLGRDGTALRSRADAARTASRPTQSPRAIRAISDALQLRRIPSRPCCSPAHARARCATRTTLREVDRVLVGEGNVVICAFSPGAPGACAITREWTVSAHAAGS